MKSSELKKVLKPLIKQCIKEVIFEEGVLSGLISEVVSGLSAVQPIVETKSQDVFSASGPDRALEKKKRLSKTKKKLSEVIAKEGYNGVNVFENTEPLSSQVGAAAAPSSPLSGYAPTDAGINIDGLFSVAGKNWSKMI